MKAYESSAKVTPEGIKLPDSLLQLLPSNQVVRVIILVSEQTDTLEQADWSRIVAEQFLAGYKQADTISMMPSYYLGEVILCCHSLSLMPQGQNGVQR